MHTSFQFTSDFVEHCCLWDIQRFDAWNAMSILIVLSISSLACFPICYLPNQPENA